MKPIVPFGLVGVLSLGTYFSVSIPLSSSEMDSEFFTNADELTRFKKSSISFKKAIENDPAGTKDYFLNGSFSLYWGDDNQGDAANAFLLNILYPDDMGPNDPNRLSYVPKPYAYGDDLIFLVGTSFTFAKKLFGKVNDWKEDVNESNNAPSLSDKATDTNKKFYISHPQPSFDQYGKSTQEIVYKLGGDARGKVYGLDRPFYFEIDKSKVEAVYAAVDLSINNDLLGMNVGNSVFESIKKAYKTNKTPDWKEEIEIDKQKYKFFVDFAVLKIKVKMIDLQNAFLSYLMKLYRKELKIPPVLNGEFPIVNGKTPPVYLAGWSSLSELEKKEYDAQNLLVKAGVKANQSTELQNKFPSEISSKEAFEEYFDFDFYEKYSAMTATTKVKSSDFEPKIISYHPNDASGILAVKYQIWSKSQSKAIGTEKQWLFGGFKKQESGSPELDSLDDYNNTKKLSDLKYLEFLETSPKSIAKWREFEIDHPYLNGFGIYAHAALSTRFLDSKNNQSVVEKINGKDSLNISHHLVVPNLEISESAKGMLALTQHPKNKAEKIMLGMYDNTTTWNNPLSHIRKLGNIMMFISPWRYDLFNHDNKLSKPSLGDSLCKKSWGKKIIQVNRFSINSNTCQ